MSLHPLQTPLHLILSKQSVDELRPKIMYHLRWRSLPALKNSSASRSPYEPSCTADDQHPLLRPLLAPGITVVLPPCTLIAILSASVAYPRVGLSHCPPHECLCSSLRPCLHELQNFAPYLLCCWAIPHAMSLSLSWVPAAWASCNKPSILLCSSISNKPYKNSIPPGSPTTP